MRRSSVMVVAVVLLTSSCGVRASHDEVVRAAGANVAPGGGAPAAGSAGRTDVAGDPTSAGAPAVTTAVAGPDAAGSDVGALGGGLSPAQEAGDPAAANDSLPPIIIGAVGTRSGPVGAVSRDFTVGVQVWVQWINAQGGIAGHQVVYRVVDDGGDPARHRALQQQLVEEEGVIAFVKNFDGLVGASAAEYPTRAGIPVIDTEGASDHVYTSPMFFPVLPAGSSLAQSALHSWAEVAVPAGNTRVALINCAEAQSCTALGQAWREHASDVGFEVVYAASSSLVAPDYTSECLNARSAGADMILVGMDGASAGRIVQSCHRQNYQPLIGLLATSATDSVRTNAQLNGMLVGTYTWAFPSEDTPAMQEFHDAFATFLPGVVPNGTHASGWVAAKAFEAAAQNMPQTPTSQAVLDGLYALNGDDLGGLTYPLTFTPGQTAPRRICWSVVVLQDEQWTAPRGGSLECAS